MSLLAVPCVLLNMGCEMVYILDQRLQAQSVAAEKAARVLREIIGSLFDRGFVDDKLFVQQELFSVASTRKLFDRLAHSSIMRLNESSMDKLFDLMFMGAKYQLLAATRLADIMQVLLRHIGGVKAILAAHAAAAGNAQSCASTILLLEHAEEATLRFYSCLSLGQAALLRQTLARFFQDKRVKVSLFLSEGIQGPTGRIILPSCIKDVVGLVREVAADGSAASEARLPLAAQRTNANEFFCHPVALGDNLYALGRPKVVPPPREADGKPAQDQAPPQEEPAPEEPPGQATRQELELLAHLVALSAPGDSFRLNLFGEGGDAFDLLGGPASPAGCPPGGGAAGQQQQRRPGQLVECGAAGGGQNDAYIRASGIQDMMQDLSVDQPGQEGDLDLLALMDSVS